MMKATLALLAVGLLSGSLAQAREGTCLQSYQYKQADIMRSLDRTGNTLASTTNNVSGPNVITSTTVGLLGNGAGFLMTTGVGVSTTTSDVGSYTSETVRDQVMGYNKIIEILTDVESELVNSLSISELQTAVEARKGAQISEEAFVAALRQMNEDRSLCSPSVKSYRQLVDFLASK